MEKRCAAVLPGRIIADLGAAHGAGLFTFEPRLHTLITEYMTALKYNGRIVRIMTNGADSISSIEFVLCGHTLRFLQANINKD